jgi:hypothetical protein
MTRGHSVTVLDRRGKTWPSALWEGLGEQRGRGGRLPAQALVEHELGHGRWGVSPVGDFTNMPKSTTIA